MAQMKPLKTCCLCASLRTGTLFAGFAGIVRFRSIHYDKLIYPLISGAGNYWNNCRVHDTRGIQNDSLGLARPGRGAHHHRDQFRYGDSHFDSAYCGNFESKFSKCLEYFY
jgi:hypothetical protein